MSRKLIATITIDPATHQRLRSWSQDNAVSFSRVMEALAKMFIEDRDLAAKAAHRANPWVRPPGFRWETLDAGTAVGSAVENAQGSEPPR